jgi:tRNA pseudouridine13 synthase
MPQNPDYTLPDWQRAHSGPRFSGTIKQSASDFQVTEILGFQPLGSGEHDFLWIEKEGANTSWVAQLLARHAGVREVDVGYSGLKDRHAITRQWFSVRRPDGSGTNWQAFAEAGVDIVEVARHDKKLRRGAHKANRFRIAVRGIEAGKSELDERLHAVSKLGVPNYFGEQRFGRHGNNMSLAAQLFAGKRMRRNKQSMAISTARSFLFNQVLQARVQTDRWDTAIAGEAFNLEGSNSIFVEDEISEELVARLTRLDIHPTGALWGKGELVCRGNAAQLEKEIVASFASWCSALEKQGVKQARRATRLVVHEMQAELSEQTLWLEFLLGKGSYATSVLREIVA